MKHEIFTQANAIKIEYVKSITILLRDHLFPGDP